MLGNELSLQTGSFGEGYFSVVGPVFSVGYDYGAAYGFLGEAVSGGCPEVVGSGGAGCPGVVGECGGVGEEWFRACLFGPGSCCPGEGGREIFDVALFSHMLFYGYLVPFFEVFSEARFIEEPPQLVGPRLAVSL